MGLRPSGRRRMSIRTWHNIAQEASMGLRPSGRRRRRPTATIPAPLLLQWGSVHPDGEGHHVSRRGGRASGWLQWGSVHPDGEGDITPKGARRVLKGLQWGSVHPDGEGPTLSRPTSGWHKLQWGSVHPDGEGILPVPPRSRDRGCFNGAPSIRTEKVYAPQP